VVMTTFRDAKTIHNPYGFYESWNDNKLRLLHQNPGKVVTVDMVEKPSLNTTTQELTNPVPQGQRLCGWILLLWSILLVTWILHLVTIIFWHGWSMNFLEIVTVWRNQSWCEDSG
jgi:hypothetical protein